MCPKRSRSSSSFYADWKISGKCIKATTSRNRFAHYCPITDFLDINHVLLEKLKIQKSIKPIDIENALNNITLSSGRIYRKRTHSYKVFVTLFVLVKEGFLRRVRHGEYAQAENYNKLEKWLEIIETELKKHYT